MTHPYQKFIRIVIFSIVFAIFIGIVALINGFLLLIILSLYLLIISLFFEAVILYMTFRRAEAGLHFLRVVLLFLFTTYVLFQL